MSETKIVSGNWTHQSLRVRLLISHCGRIEASLCLLRLYMCENNCLLHNTKNIFIDKLNYRLPQVVAYTASLAVVPLLDFVESEQTISKTIKISNF